MSSTPAARRLRVAVLYGGRSGEHEVSLQSAALVLRNLDPERFEPLPIAIDKAGHWHPGDVSLIERGAPDAARLPRCSAGPPAAEPTIAG